MRTKLLLCLLAGTASLCRAQIEVGSGAPNEVTRQGFITAFYRGSFQSLVTLPPAGNVTSFGTTGYRQEFNSSTGSGKLALVRGTAGPIPVVNGEPVTDVFQLQSALYAYYTSVGVTTAGFPTMDTQNCPPVLGNSCTYQFFDKNYVLFAYLLPNEFGQNFFIRDSTTGNFYTKWVAGGGISGLGPATSGEQTSQASVSGILANIQTYSQGATFNITSGTLAGRLISVRNPIYDLWVAQGGRTVLGLPLFEETVQPDGRRRQVFERGAIEYVPGQPPVLQRPVSTVLFTSSTAAFRLSQGETLSLSVRLFAQSGEELLGRSVTWTTSNGTVAAITPDGASVTVRAAGGGTATITATSEAKTASVTITVVAPCCAVGEGAPNATVGRSFSEAVTRNRLDVQLPARDPVRRVGAGYAQELVETGTNARVLLARPDGVATAYLVRGELLAKYEALGGAAGPLGYPSSDATPSGRQLFQGGALAGSPARLVTGQVLAKWAALGYEAGIGLPAGDPVRFLTFAASSGVSQAFQNSVIYAGETGGQAKRAFLAAGLILARYSGLGGPAGRLGMPVGDEYSYEGRKRQDFEGGFIEFAPGDEEARETESLRQPAVTATPPVVTAGGRVRVAVGGFEPERNLRISVAGAPDFWVWTSTGAHIWEVPVALNARGGTVTIDVEDGGGGARASGSYQVRALAESGARLVKLGGDTQSGPPAGLLPLPLRVALRDDAGNPVAGASVVFEASPGAAVVRSSAVTDESGAAEAWLRLPPLEGVSLVRVEAAGDTETFAVRAAATRLKDYPAFSQAVDGLLGAGPASIRQKGALLAAAASMLRYYQNRRDVPAPQGFVDPAALNRFLSDFCLADAGGAAVCDGFVPAPGTNDPVVNLWRVPDYAGGALEVISEAPEELRVRDLLAGGHPALLALELEAGGAPLGAHFVVATGVAANAWIEIHDPNPAFGRGALNDYLLGFESGGRVVKGKLSGVIRFAPQPPAQTGFLVAGGAPVEVTSAAGSCGASFSFPALLAEGPQQASAASQSLHFRYCGGASDVYQVDLAGQGPTRAFLTSLGEAGGRTEMTAAGAVSYRVFRMGARWHAVPQDLVLADAAVTNAANPAAALSPGALAVISGSGLARPGAATRVEIGGVPVRVLSATPFRLHVQLPLDVAPGTYPLRVESPYGGADGEIRLSAVGPAVFATPGVVVNQDGTVNSSTSPARRGQTIVVHCTGLGAVTAEGALLRAVTPVVAVIGGQDVPIQFAGIAAGLPGVYQVNVVLPPALAPGIGIELRLRQGGVESNAASLAVE